MSIKPQKVTVDYFNEKSAEVPHEISLLASNHRCHEMNLVGEKVPGEDYIYRVVYEWRDISYSNPENAEKFAKKCLELTCKGDEMKIMAVRLEDITE